MPKCSCYDWCKTGYLCKYFLAVFEKFPSWSFNALSPIYINSPFLNLDKTVIPLLKENTLTDSTYTKKQNKIVSNLEEPNEMDKSAVINLQSLPSQARRKKTSAAIFREYLKEVKDLSYLVENLVDTLNEALDYLINIRRLLQGAVPKESGIYLEPTKAGSKRKSFSSFALPLTKKKDRNIGRHGEAARLSKKYRNVKVDLRKITRPNPIETETVILEDPLPEKKQQEVFELSSEEEKEELLHKNLEVNKLPDEEIKLITGNGMLTDLTPDKCQFFKKSISRPIRASSYRTWTKTDVQGTKGRICADIAQWKLSLGCSK